MVEGKVRYYKGTFYSQFVADQTETIGGVYKSTPIRLEQRFQLKVDEEISRDQYFSAKKNRMSPGAIAWQKDGQFRHLTKASTIRIEPHILVDEPSYIELEFETHKEREIASELYVELDSSKDSLQDLGLDFLAFKDGLWHGRLNGIGYCAVPEFQEAEKLAVLEKIQKRELESNARNGCLGPLGGLAARGGCSPLSLLRIPNLFFGRSALSSGGCASGGCGKMGCGLLILLALLAFAMNLMKGCSEQIQSIRGPRVIHDTIYVDENSKEDIIKKFLDTTTIARTEAIELPNVQFYTNSAKLLPYSINSIQQLAEYLIEHSQVEATIIGHTDNQGETQANLTLSQSRAETVKQVLVNFGVENTRVEAIGRGESNPRTTNETIEGRALNRRVEVRLKNIEHIETKRTEVNE